MPRLTRPSFLCFFLILYGFAASADDVRIDLRIQGTPHDFATFICNTHKHCGGDNILVVDGVQLWAKYSLEIIPAQNDVEVRFAPIMIGDCRFSLQSSPYPNFLGGAHSGDLRLAACGLIDDMASPAPPISQVIVTVTLVHPGNEAGAAPPH